MLDGTVPPALRDPISFELVRAPLRVGTYLQAFSEQGLLRFMGAASAPAPALPWDDIHPRPLLAGGTRRAPELAAESDRLREAAELMWRVRGDRLRAWATRWLRRHTARQEARAAPDLGGPSGRAVAQALTRRGRTSPRIAEAVARSVTDPIAFFARLGELEAHLVEVDQRLRVVGPHRSRPRAELVYLWMTRMLVALMAAHVLHEATEGWTDPPLGWRAVSVASALVPHPMEVLFGVAAVMAQNLDARRRRGVSALILLFAASSSLGVLVQVAAGGSKSRLHREVGPLIGLCTGLLGGLTLRVRQRNDGLRHIEGALPGVQEALAEEAVLPTALPPGAGPPALPAAAPAPADHLGGKPGP